MISFVIVGFFSLATGAAPDLSGFESLPADPEPKELTRGSHYWIGNEDRMDVFYDDVKDKGGVHIGVGAEQNWLLAGWSKPQVAVMMDFDQSIVDLQRVYFVAFATAATKEEFKALWLDKTRAGLRAGVMQLPKGLVRSGAIEALKVSRWSIERRFAKLEEQMTARGLSCFLNDDAQYAWLHELVTTGRAFSVRGDLTANKTVQAIAAAAKKAALPVRTLYLSNAEQYFMYKKSTRENFASLPFDDDSVVLRTHGWVSLSYAKDGNSYHYGVQSGPSFKAFAADPLVWASRQILLWAPADSEKGTSKETSKSPAAAKASWEARVTAGKAAKASARPRPATPRATATAPTSTATTAPAPAPAAP